MKKFVALLLVLGMASYANASVISLVTDGVGDRGNAGTEQNPLEIGETIKLALVLNHNPYPGVSYPSYDGYLLYSMDLKLTVSGNGSLGATVLKDKQGNPTGIQLGEHTSWSVKPSAADMLGFFQSDGIERLPYGSLDGISGAMPEGGAANPKLVHNFWLTCTGEGRVILALSILPGSQGEYYDFTDMNNSGPSIIPPANLFWLTDNDLGSLVLYQVPEPMTLALLGLGGLGMLYRRRRA